MVLVHFLFGAGQAVTHMTGQEYLGAHQEARQQQWQLAYVLLHWVWMEEVLPKIPNSPVCYRSANILKSCLFKFQVKDVYFHDHYLTSSGRSGLQARCGCLLVCAEWWVSRPHLAGHQTLGTFFPFNTVVRNNSCPCRS